MTDKQKAIFLDYHSTTPTDARVANLMLRYMTDTFGNASSVDHTYGDDAAAAISQAKHHIAELVGASSKEIIFTSGATESINLAIRGTITNQSCPRIAVSPVEHEAVIDTCQTLEKQGAVELVYLQVDERGRIDFQHLESLCANGLSLLCVMAANNEIGNIYFIEKIGAIAQKYNVPFFCDASQAVGKIPIRFHQWKITLLAISAHKLYGPKGCGALVVRKGYQLEPLLYGGRHQKGLRSGTLNVPAIVGFGEACRLRYQEMDTDEPAIAKRRDRLQSLLQQSLPHLVVNGDLDNRLAGNLHIALPNIPNDAVIARIRDRLAISTGAACSSGVETPSHVLRAIGLPENFIDGALRIGIGKFTSDADIETAARILTEEIVKIRQLLTNT